ncbi:F-box protein: endocytic membrane traffic, recycling ReCYcling 1 [Coemansia spiralis]|uniref:F-box protein: endocytic membrane traffic, recycling ReCYcling 1 n=1 Tax=Coemansia spiralis TaxID=417178 RepID=A0A9W8KYR0_9FUNG|nr:F-box protein: endocytic membrane traffic, recycling ReCYcling 1 [Coemansia sp. RSA 1358]KAJ2679903.1 F-box protein: endocytic membrane traffic, recycling ReCYcling 1 [Coemansia spiralis]
MSDYEDDQANTGKLAPSWLSMPSPRTLLDRTTKFVLNATHGKSRSLIPTTEDTLDGGSFIETSVQAEGDETSPELGAKVMAEIDTSEVDNTYYSKKKEGESDNEGTIVVPETDVLLGKWNSFHILSKIDRIGPVDEGEETRSITPPGMLRIRPIKEPNQKLPPRIRTPAIQQRSQQSQSRLSLEPAVESTRSRSSSQGVIANRARSSSKPVYIRRRAITFTSLPPRIVAQIFEFLPVPEMLLLLNSCRVVRRVMHKSGPGSYAEVPIGDQAYTLAGMRIWRTMLRRMGWRLWQERVRGQEKRQRVSIPKSHGRLIKQFCGVEDEGELLEIIHTEPDLLFKAMFDNMYSDYTAFRSLEHSISPVMLQTQELYEDDQETGSNPREFGAKRWRAPAEVAERLDQLLWFGRGWFTHDSDDINKRIVVAADRFEEDYRRRFKCAFVAGNCERMRKYAGILENIREGCGCIRILVDSHPLFNCTSEFFGSHYAHVLSASSKVVDSHTFDVFLEGLQAIIEEHASVVALAFPPPALPASALYCFIQELFSAREGYGIALATLQRLYAHLRSIPVAEPSSLLMGVEDALRGLSQKQSDEIYTRQPVPDEATKDILYLTTVANVVSLLLVAAEKWASMNPVSIPAELGRRCVFSAFNDVIVEYVQLEKRVIERAYDQELDQWISTVRAKADIAGGGGSVGKSGSGGADDTGFVLVVTESIRLVNFRQRQQQMDEYKQRVLRVLEGKLKISLPPEMLGTSTNPAEEVAQEPFLETSKPNLLNGENKSATDNENKTDPGGTKPVTFLGPTQKQPHVQLARRRSSASQQTEAPRRTVVGDVLWNSPISINLCLNMVLTNRDAIDRLAVFAEAPPDMRLRRLAIGNHVRPAFTRIVAELKELEHTAMVVMVSQGRQTSTGGTSGGDHTNPSHTSILGGAASGPALGSARHGGGGSMYSAQRVQAEKELREKFTSVELRFFELIHLSDLAVHMLEIYHKKDMCVFIDEADFLNICNQEKKALEHAIDDSIAVGMDCVIEIILRQTQHILDTEQRNDDYHPDTNVSLTLTPTLACTRAVQFLGESTTMLHSMTTQKQMREVFLGEIGVRLFNILLEHIKRFQITEPGGFQLIADLNLYYDWAAENVDPDTLRFFTALKDLANCFILAPRDLRGFLRDQYSRRTFDGVMRMEEIYDVVACRADYRAIRTQVEGHCDFM